jgi:hypothetical protein
MSGRLLWPQLALIFLGLSIFAWPCYQFPLIILSGAKSITGEATITQAEPPVVSPGNLGLTGKGVDDASKRFAD